MPARSRSRKTDSGDDLSLTRALRECLACGMIVVDDRDKIIACTPEAGHLLRLKHGAVAGGSLSLLPAPLQKIIREVATTKTPASHRSLALPPNGSDSTALHVSAVPVQSRGSLEVVVLLNDISLAKRLEEDMRRLDRLATIGTLSASMGHEIKNALVAVKTFVELLLEKNPGSELAETVRRELRRIDSIVSQMLRFAGPGQPAVSALRLHELLEHSLRLVQHQLERKLISLNRSFKAAPDSITGDDYQLEQAFVNLFLNAVEAMPANGSLTVATEFVKAAPAKSTEKSTVLSPGSKPGDSGLGTHVRVTISDTGPGIVPENMERLFDPFFTTKPDGTGLGLPITRRILQEHHGDISVQSEVNKGTTFSILLPARARAH